MGWKSVAIAVVLAGVAQAATSQQSYPTSSAHVEVTAELTPEQQATDLRERQQACLQEKVDAAQQASKAQSGFGTLLSAVKPTPPPSGSPEAIAQISDAADRVYSAGVTMGDLKGAAADLGISESDIEICRNP